MKGKIIVIAGAELEISFSDGKPTGSAAGGTLLNVAAELARRGVKVSVVSELGQDRAGDMIAGYLADSGVDIRSIDRTVEASTPVVLKFDDGSSTRYGNRTAGDDGLDVVWPDIDRDDTLVFGEYMAIAPAVRHRLWQLVSHASERKLRIIYFPGDLADREPRITRVMPVIFENLEAADAVITTPAANRHIFGTDDSVKVFGNHVSFYCDTLADVDTANGVVNWLGAGCGAVAGGSDEVKAIADAVEAIAGGK